MQGSAKNDIYFKYIYKFFFSISFSNKKKTYVFTDVDECAKNPCKSFERCLNTIGSYKCEKLPTTIRPTLKAVTTIKTTTLPDCGTGYKYDIKAKGCTGITDKHYVFY